MREALHVIDKDLIRLPFSASQEKVINLKKLAEKDLFQCLYCQARLIVKYGDERGLYFSHKHSEACEISKKIDHAERKYVKQIERETKTHNVILSVLYDELSNQAKRNTQISVELGYKAKPELKEYPDIWVKVGVKEFAVSVVTNVSPGSDTKLANQIIRRQSYFSEQGMVPIWFIEKKEQSIEFEKNAIVLWDAELSISAKTPEDREWDSKLAYIIKDNSFFNLFNYPVSRDNLEIDVRSMYYIYTKEERIVVKVQRFLKDRLEKPYRAFLLNDGYEIPFAEALVIKNEFLLSNPETEKLNRENFITRYKKLEDELLERQRIEIEKRQNEEKQRKLKEEERQKLLQQILHQMPKQIKITKNLSYSDLKSLLRERINLKQQEQMELWTHFMPQIGFNNSSLVWDLVEEHNCTSFNELRIVLRNHLRNN